MAIKTGELTGRFIKGSDRDKKLTPTAGETVDRSESGIVLMKEIANRLSKIEFEIKTKPGQDRIISQIMLSNDAMLLSSSKIGVVGDVSFFDYVRDQNGKAIGQIDPSVTRIRGGVIQTEKIISGNLSDELGTSFDLDDGILTMGGTLNPRFEYKLLPSELSVRGICRVKDTLKDDGISIDYGMFQTGTANFDAINGATGNGIIVGSPGIFGINNGNVKFSFDAATGNAFFGGEIITDEFIRSKGKNDAGFTVDFVGVTFDVFSSSWGENNIELTDTSRFVVGVSGTTTGVYSATAIGVGVMGIADATSGSASRGFGVVGLGYDGAAAGFFYSTIGVGLHAQTNAAATFAIECIGGGGISAVTLTPALSRAVYGDGSIHTTQKFTTNGIATGTVTLTPTLGGAAVSYNYRFD